MKEPQNAMQAMPRTIWNRFGFGTCNCNWADDEDGFAPGYLTAGTIAVFGWADRLRILISGKVNVEAAVKTDAIVTRSMARSAVSVLPPNYPVGRVR